MVSQTSHCLWSLRHHTVCGLSDITLSVVSQISHCLWSLRYHTVCDLSDITLSVVSQTSHCLWSLRYHTVCGLSDITLPVISETSQCLSCITPYCMLVDCASFTKYFRHLHQLEQEGESYSDDTSSCSSENLVTARYVPEGDGQNAPALSGSANHISQVSHSRPGQCRPEGGLS